MDEPVQKWGELFLRLAPMIVTLGVIGILLIMGLLIAWRRSQRRMREIEEQRDHAREEQSVHIDTWSTAAQRMEVDTPPNRPAAPDAPPPGSEAPWDNEDADENAPWRESLGDIPDFSEEEDEDEDEDDEDDEEDDKDRP